MTRPEKPIDWDKVDNLLMAGCKGTEICPHFDMHPNTFYDRVAEKYKMSFTEYSTQKRSKGDSLLLAKQFEKAIKGDNTLLIWLGKTRLGQTDHISDTPPNDKKLDLILESINNSNDTKPETKTEL